MQKIFYEKEIDLLHQLKELVSLTVDESIDYKIEDHGVRAVGSLAIKGEYISQEKRHFLENVELDVYADDQKIIDHQDFHLKVEDFHYDIIDGNLKIKIEVGVYGVEEGENRYIQLDEDPIDEIEKLCSRLIIVDKGQIVFDGDKRLFNNVKSDKIIRFKNENNISMEYLESISKKVIDGDEIELVVLADKVNEIVSFLVKNSVSDINISDESLEDLLIKFYGENNK